jgi:hypothetical protein
MWRLKCRKQAPRNNTLEISYSGSQYHKTRETEIEKETDRQIDRQTAAAAAKGTKKLTEKEKDTGRCFYQSRSSYEKESALARRKRRSEQHRSSLAMVGRCVLLHCDEEEEEDDVR